MTRAAWLAAIQRGPARLPASLVSTELLDELLQLAMVKIRQDMSLARRLAVAAQRIAVRLDDDLSRGRAERLRGHVALLSGRPKRAIPHYRTAREWFAEHPDERNTTAIGMLQALAYVGEYAQSFHVGNEARAYFAAAGDRLRTAKVELNLGNAYQRLDQLAEARALYASALETLREVGTPEDVAIALRNFSVCLTAMEEWSAAEAMLEASRSTFVRAGHRLLVLEIDLNTAYLRARQGRVKEALLGARAVREQLSAQRDDLGFEIGHVLLDQADVLLDAGLWSEAELAAAEALGVFRRLGLRFEVSKAQLLLGWARARRGVPDQPILREARRGLSRGPNKTWAALSWLAWSEAVPEDRRAALRRALDLSPEQSERRMALLRAWAAHSLEPEAIAALPMTHAVDWAIRAKASGSPEDARRALELFDAARRDLGPAVLRHGARTANAEVLAVALSVLRDPIERLAVVQRQKHQVLAELLASPESRPAAKGGESEQEQLAEWRLAGLGADTAWIESAPTPDPRFAEIFEDGGRLHAIIGTQEHDLGSSAEWISKARYLRMHLARGLRNPTDGAAQRALDEMAIQLAPLESVECIGRGGPLGGLPIHAIFPVTYAPSLGVHHAVQNQPPRTGEGATVLGHADDLAPEIEAELQSVTALLAAFPRVPMESARVIHLAAHGIHREDQPLFSAMRLGDRQLTAFDLLQSNLKAELVVLSGCSTGLGSAGFGTDTEGFVEALFTAGARHVIASLWDVDDRVTREWMEAFYRAWCGGAAVDVAHQNATRTTKNRYPHPAHWAAFALFGGVSKKDRISKGNRRPG